MGTCSTASDSDGKVPCQIDGGPRFGHPIGASGLRMIYEMYLQMQAAPAAPEEAGARVRPAHNLGGFPAQRLRHLHRRQMGISSPMPFRQGEDTAHNAGKRSPELTPL